MATNEQNIHLTTTNTEYGKTTTNKKILSIKETIDFDKDNNNNNNSNNNDNSSSSVSSVSNSSSDSDFSDKDNVVQQKQCNSDIKHSMKLPLITGKDKRLDVVNPNEQSILCSPATEKSLNINFTSISINTPKHSDSSSDKSKVSKVDDETVLIKPPCDTDVTPLNDSRISRSITINVDDQETNEQYETLHNNSQILHIDRIVDDGDGGGDDGGDDGGGDDDDENDDDNITEDIIEDNFEDQHFHHHHHHHHHHHQPSQHHHYHHINDEDKNDDRDNNVNNRTNNSNSNGRLIPIQFDEDSLGSTGKPSNMSSEDVSFYCVNSPQNSPTRPCSRNSCDISLLSPENSRSSFSLIPETEPSANFTQTRSFSDISDHNSMDSGYDTIIDGRSTIKIFMPNHRLAPKRLETFLLQTTPEEDIQGDGCPNFDLSSVTTTATTITTPIISTSPATPSILSSSSSSSSSSTSSLSKRKHSISTNIHTKRILYSTLPTTPLSATSTSSSSSLSSMNSLKSTTSTSCFHSFNRKSSDSVDSTDEGYIELLEMGFIEDDIIVDEIKNNRPVLSIENSPNRILPTDFNSIINKDIKLKSTNIIDNDINVINQNYRQPLARRSLSLNETTNKRDVFRVFEIPSVPPPPQPSITLLPPPPPPPLTQSLFGQLEDPSTTSLNNLKEFTECNLTSSPSAILLASKGSFKRPESPDQLINSPVKTKRFKHEKENLLNGLVIASGGGAGAGGVCIDSPKILRPTLRKSISMSDANIMSALARSYCEPDLIGDFSKPFCLPLMTNGKHCDLKSITCHTMAKLLLGNYINTVASFKVIDCRYPYEYEGGHIEGAQNLYTHDQILVELVKSKTEEPPPHHHHQHNHHHHQQQHQYQHQLLHQQYENEENNCGERKRHILVFHCEFSSERGPKLSRFLRNLDRSRNTYPTLHYPEIYLLHGGYKEFYENYSELCTPKNYRTMLDPAFGDAYKHFRSKSKSWGYEQKYFSGGSCGGGGGSNVGSSGKIGRRLSNHNDSDDETSSSNSNNSKCNSNGDSCTIDGIRNRDNRGGFEKIGDFGQSSSSRLVKTRSRLIL